MLHEFSETIISETMNSHDVESEIKSWLKIALSKENLDDFSVKILGNSEKGDGYVGDIVFVLVSATTKSGLAKEYNLVLKCSKRSEILRNTSPVKEAFDVEIYIYDVLLPTFTKFQLEKGIKEPFNSVPKCYGTYKDDNTEIIVFENLMNMGYTLWDKKSPLTRRHIEMVIGEYAKIHAISMAMEVEHPEKIKEFDRTLIDVFDKFCKMMDTETMYGKFIDEIGDALKNELDESVLVKWKNFKKQINYILGDFCQNLEGKRVIVHGDCWNNNFLFKHTTDGTYLPLKVAILDWQIARYTSPIFDLSYHIFSTISKEDLEDLDSILNHYHLSLTSYLKSLGHDVKSLYPIDQFLEEWKKYCKYGILLSCLIMKIISTDKEDVIDLADAAESGEGINQIFSYELKDSTVLKTRMGCIVKYAYKNNLI